MIHLVQVNTYGSPRHRYVGVQALRAVAALLVVCAHVPSYVRDRAHVDAPVIPTGQLGVTVFFAISGLVAVLTTQGRTGQGAGHFARNRLVRILPLAWLVLTTKLVVGLVAPGTLERFEADGWYVVASYLFLPATGPDGIVQPLYTVMWTLSFELFFYAVVTLALAAHRRPIDVVAPVMTVLACASTLRPEHWPAWQFHADPYVLLFIVGMAIGHVVTGSATRMTTTWGVVAVIAWTGSVVATHGLGPTVALLPVATAVLALTLWVERRIPDRTAPPLLLLGDASYALYLTHPLVGPVTVAVLTAALPVRLPWAATAAFAVTVSVAVSIATWFAVDRPLVRLLRTRRRRSRDRVEVLRQERGTITSEGPPPEGAESGRASTAPTAVPLQGHAGDGREQQLEPLRQADGA